jgi:glutathione S-transferase
MPNYRLISFELCPYVQRCVMTLREKDVAYDIDYVDLDPAEESGGVLR